ncbi:urea transporter 2-like isoform X2 [Zootermopsis nevadensis]|uniref:urea transporter 2-like isoform X2 n=1 Tax=Zootermopsis nevadensis TaxID=136037 RepID=UPI000B8E4DCA|nr:urea transporter 2-like isoform X2 [Zootermopsis nevadensis]
MSDTNDACDVSRVSNRRFRDKVSKQWLSFAGDCAPIRKYLASRSFGSYWAPIKFLDALFRGYGQVVFANNPISGILIFMVLTVADPLVSAAGLLTASVGLLVSIMILPQPSEVLGQGVTVFNSLLVGLITSSTLPTRYGLELETWHWFSMIIASIISVYVESAISNILGSLCQFPLPILTVPFNIVQPLLFLTVININTQLTASNTVAVTTAHHVTLQPPPLVPSSLIIDQVPGATTQQPLPFFPNSLTEPNSASVLMHELGTHNNAFVAEVQDYQDVNTHTNFQHITTKPSEILDFENNIKHSRTTREDTFDADTESGKDLNLKNDSRLNVNELEYVEYLTTAADDFRETGTSAITVIPEQNQSTPAELLNASISRLQSHSGKVNDTYSVGSVVQLLQDKHNFIVEEDYDAGIQLSPITSSMESSTSEISPLYSTNSANIFEEENIPADEDAVSRRVKRSLSLEVTPHQNASSDVMEHIVDWGGVFSGVVLSMSQVYGVSQAPTAILIYLAVIVYSPISAAFAVLGAAIGTLTGLLLTDVDTYAVAGGVYDGTWGFNGLLSAMCLGGVFFVLNWPATIAVVLCSFLSTFIMNVLISPFAEAGLSPMSLPFNLGALLFLCVSSSGYLVRPNAVTFPEKHRQEYRSLHLQETQEESPPTSNLNDKDEGMEKNVLSEVKIV